MANGTVRITSKVIELALKRESFSLAHLERVLSDSIDRETYEEVLEELESQHWIGHENETWHPGVRAILLANDKVQTPDTDGFIESVIAARDVIREQDGATTDKIINALEPEKNYKVGLRGSQMVGKLQMTDEYRDWWWRQIVRPGLQELPEIDRSSDEQSQWQWST